MNNIDNVGIIASYCPLDAESKSENTLDCLYDM